VMLATHERCGRNRSAAYALPAALLRCARPGTSFFLASLLLSAIASAAENASKVGNAGSVDAGQELIGRFGCGACHEIPGIVGARGLLGPPLSGVGKRVFIAGVLRNTPENMATWVFDPQAVIRGNAMPSVGLSRKQSQDVAAYLSTLH